MIISLHEESTLRKPTALQHKNSGKSWKTCDISQGNNSIIWSRENGEFSINGQAFFVCVKKHH